MTQNVLTNDEAVTGSKHFFHFFCYFWKVCNKPQGYFSPSSNINPPYCTVCNNLRARVFSLIFKPPTNFGRGSVRLNWVWTHVAKVSLKWGEANYSSGGGSKLLLWGEANYSSMQLLNSGAVFKKYKASVEISSGGTVYTKDSGSGVLLS
jgi:hypothetical protein